MKLLIAICMSLVILGWSAPLVEGAKYGLASAWLFEETSGKVAKDSVSGHDGELKGTPTWVANGKFGRGIEFPGKGDSYIRIDHANVFNADPYTFVVWTKLKPTTWQYVVWRNGDVWPENLSRKPGILISGFTRDHYPVFMWNVGNGEWGRIDGKAIVADDKWHHIAKIYDGKSMKMYIDGKIDGELATKKIDQNVSPIWIGARPRQCRRDGYLRRGRLLHRSVIGSPAQNHNERWIGTRCISRRCWQIGDNLGKP